MNRKLRQQDRSYKVVEHILKLWRIDCNDYEDITLCEKCGCETNETIFMDLDSEPQVEVCFKCYFGYVDIIDQDLEDGED